MNGTKSSPRIVIWEIDGNVVHWPPLAKYKTDTLQIGGDIWPHHPPRVLVIENCSGVEAPSRILDALGRVRPSMPNELVNAFEKMPVGLGFHVQRRCAKHWRVKPGPGFRRRNWNSVDMTCRRSPTRGGKRLPLRSFTFRKVGKRAA